MSFMSLLKSKSPLIGTFVSFNTPYVTQILGRCGFDWLMIDMEHSPLSAQEITNMVHATITSSEGTCLPIVRIPSHGVEWVKWALDSGASGIIVPMVNTKEEAEGVIKRGVYPPGGARSYGPFRAPFANLSKHSTPPQYKQETAKDVMIFPMIESAEAVENAEAIMSVEGVTGIFIGPVDLRHSLGFSGPEGVEGPYLAALEKVVKIGKALGKPVGILATKGSLCRLISMGFDYVMMAGGDSGILADAATLLVEDSKAALKEAKLL